MHCTLQVAVCLLLGIGSPNAQKVPSAVVNNGEYFVTHFVLLLLIVIHVV